MELFKHFYKIIPILVGYSLLKKFGLLPRSEFRKYLCRFTCLLGYLVLGTGLILGSGYIVFEANTFQEFSDDFYGFITLVNDSFYFLYMPWFCENTLELNMRFVAVINERELLLRNQILIFEWNFKVDCGRFGESRYEKNVWKIHQICRTRIQMHLHGLRVHCVPNQLSASSVHQLLQILHHRFGERRI